MSDNDQANDNQFVRIGQDSDTALQALFDLSLNPNDKKRPLPTPLRKRNLPSSFFIPPSTGSRSPSISVSHSRENSDDLILDAVTTTTPTVGLQTQHSRTRSSPASLQQMYTSLLEQQQHCQQQHLRQRSFDIATVDEHDLGPLPSGWEQAKTADGQIYFLNHNDKITTWNDPRKMNQQQQQCLNTLPNDITSANLINSFPPAAEQGTVNFATGPAPFSNASSVAGSGTGSSGTLSPVGNELAVGPLPEGWEQGITEEGEVYFLNHITKTTSWYDPRISTQLQRVPSGAIPPQKLQNWIQHQIRMNALKAERDRLQTRQREIQRNDIISQTRRGDPSLASAGIPIATPDKHNRQGSADSGLGMGNNYSLPPTPEDFLNSIDDFMDAVNEDDAAGISALDAQEIPLTNNLNSTEDLPSPLQLDEKLLSDVMSNVSNQPDGLAWL